MLPFALKYASRGLRVIPIVPGAKRPAIKDWTNAATTDPEQIKAWWDNTPGANAGICTGAGSGIFVLDVDPKNDGPATLAALEFENSALPRTWVHKTPSGGEHHYFKHPGFVVTNRAGRWNGTKLPGLDIRGDGGQVVAPPSVTEAGAYSVETEGDAPEAPAWLLDLLRPSAAPIVATVTGRQEFPPATPEIIEAARAALKRHGPAVQGNGGDVHTWRAAALLRNDFALTEDEAAPLFQEWNGACQPPWSERDLRAKLSGGLKYAKGIYGARRELDPLALVRKLCLEFHGSGRDPLDLLETCRQLEWDDPAKRELAQTEIKSATRLTVRAIALQPVQRKRAERVTVYDLKLTPGGSPHSNLANASAVVTADALEVYYDEFSHRLEREDGSEWDDQCDRELAIRMQRELDMSGMQVETVRQAVVKYALENRRNSLQDYLLALKWDRKKRLEHLFTRGFGSADGPYTRAASANFVRSLVARGLRPGCKVDTMPVLEGAQGARKSSGLRALVGSKFFAESSENPHSKDFYISLQGKWLVEVAEMDSFGRADVAAVKRILTCQVDRYRPPYGRSAQDFGRTAVFAGTTNRDDWQRDDTGARRFWPILVGRVDLEWIVANRDQLFAEAVQEVAEFWRQVDRGAEEPTTGRWWLMPEAETLDEQNARRQDDPWLEPVHTYMTSTTEPVTASEVAAAIGVPVEEQDSGTISRMKSVLRAVGAEKRRVRLRDRTGKYGAAPLHYVWLPLRG